MRSAPLLTWDGDALVVWNYPVDKQQEVQLKRKGGANGGRSRSQAKAQAARMNGTKHNPSLTQGEPKLDPSLTQAQPKLEPNGKERKGKEGNRKQSIAQAGFQPSEHETVYLAYPRKVGKGKALKEIAKAIARGNTPEDLTERAQAFATAVAGWDPEDLRFVPHPATWFAQDRFLDDPAEWSRKSSAKDPQGESMEAFIERMNRPIVPGFTK